jgi:hypothetical protein
MIASNNAPILYDTLTPRYGGAHPGYDEDSFSVFCKTAGY